MIWLLLAIRCRGVSVLNAGHGFLMRMMKLRINVGDDIGDEFIIF